MLRRPRLRILAPVNGTSASQHAFRWCCQLARNSRADLLAIYVFEIPMEFAVESVRGQRDIQEGETILNQIEGIAEAEHCKVSANMVAARNAGPAIVLEATERDIDLLVVGVALRPRSAYSVGGTHRQLHTEERPLPGASFAGTCPRPFQSAGLMACKYSSTVAPA